jgi:predicted RNase H-like HicB family nuclease
MSETYTAVYERDGESWVVKIAEEPRVTSRSPTLAKAREHIHNALALWLTTDPEKLHILDDIRLPAQVRAVQETVKATRTDTERSEMLASMTGPRSARAWAEDLGLASRDADAVGWLSGLEDVEVDVDQLCYAISTAEELARWGQTGDGDAPDGDVTDEDPARS